MSPIGRAEIPGPGRGTTFTVRLPVNSAAVSPAAVASRVTRSRDATPADAFPSLAGVRVLVARDQDRGRVQAAGYDVYLAKPVEPAELARAVADLAGRPVG